MFEVDTLDERKLNFATIDELREFLTKERDSWSPLLGARTFGEIQSIVQSALHAAERYAGDPGDYQLDQLRTELRNFSAQIESRGYLLSSSAIAQYLHGEAKVDLDIAARIADLYRNPSSAINNGLRDFSAAFRLNEFERGLSKSSVSSLRVSLAQLESRFLERLHEFEAKSSDLTTRFDKAVHDRMSRAEASAGAMAKLLLDRKESSKNSLEVLLNQADKFNKKIAANAKEMIATSIQNASKDLDDFVSKQKDAISLQAPITYWTDKSGKHRLATIASGIVFILYSCFSIWALFSVILTLGGDLPSFFRSAKDFGLEGIALFATMIAIGLIFARIVYRIFISQLHLWNDASERVTLIKTYLSLAERGHARDEFLGGLLARLFAPASDGLAKEDLGTVNPIDFLTRNAGKP